MEEERTWTFCAGEDDAGERLDRFLAGQLPEHSRSYLQKCIAERRIQKNGVPAKGSARIQAGDRITAALPAPVEAQASPEDIPLDILYEDDQLLIVNKPKGMVVHPAPGHAGGTLVNAVLWHCRGNLSGINGVLRPGIVHRIDRDTSGSLVICKTDAAHQSLAAQLKDHTITRRYRAVVWGCPEPEEGTVDAPVGRHPKDRIRMAVNYEHGKRAVTHYRVLERFKGFAYLECSLETGRTHQIRVHMASIGHPLLGDSVYGPAKNPFGIEGQVLHAMVLGFIHPTTGQYLEVSAPIPDDMQKLLKKLTAG